MTIDNSGNIYVGCSSKADSSQSNDYDILMIKYSSSGSLLWKRSYGSSALLNDEPVDIKYCAATSSIILTGYAEYQNTLFEIVMLKYDLNGNNLWSKTYLYPLSLTSKPKSLAVDGSGNIIIAGFTALVSNDFLIIKYCPDGILSWASVYTGIISNGIDECKAVQAAPNGNIYVTGSSSGNPNQLISSDIVTIKLSPTGEKVWTERYNTGANLNDEPADMIIDQDENVYIAGKSQIISNGNYVFKVIKYNTSGYREWVDEYGSPGTTSSAMALAKDMQNNIIAAGYTDENPETNTDFHPAAADNG